MAANILKISQVKPVICTAAVIILSLCGAVWAQAGETADFPPEFSNSGINMKLQGVGEKSMLFIKAFEAGLYKEDGVDLEAAAKKIRVRYHVSIPGRKLSDFTIKSMLDNISKEEFNTLDREIRLMRQYFVDLEPGDTYELMYIPQIGTKFLHNGELVGIIEGERFSKALYAVWIGDKPFDKKLKKQILGVT